MNIQELDNHNLEDAVKFHDHLNPRLWGRDQHLLPEVQEKLRAVAADFQEFLGVPDLKLRDITISGSNAAYTYTPNSDIDLHLVVEMPADPVYKELFNAKKYQYNDEHDIRIGGADVELYVQPADEKHISQGIYSILNQDWLRVPSRKRAAIDDSCVLAKTEDLEQRIDLAVKSENTQSLERLWNKIKEMRRSGLAQHGEFGCENLVFKMLRRSGALGKLKAARNAAHDRELSLMEKGQKKKRWNYNGYWYPGFGYAGQDSGSDHVDQAADAGGDGLAEDQNFVVQFSAFRPNGERINKKFRVKAADKYRASDKIKEKFGAEYDTFTHPVFKFGKTDRGIASDYVASLARGLREQGVAEGKVSGYKMYPSHDGTWYVEDEDENVVLRNASRGEAEHAVWAGNKKLKQNVAELKHCLKQGVAEDKENTKTLYHVTLTKHLPAIVKKGILSMQPTNWVQAGSKKQYGNIGEIFAFDNVKDAIRWASNWDWDLHKELGSGKISIVAFKDDADWDVDTADPISQSGNKGQWRKRQGAVKADKIEKTFPVTLDLVKSLSQVDEAGTPDGVSPSTRMFLSETELTNTIRDFIQRVCEKLKIENRPQITFHLDNQWSTSNKTFGRYDPNTCTLHVSLVDRHPMDIMRTVAHELVHCRQNELQELPLDAGETGSKWENQANALAGVIMRDMAHDRPEMFEQLDRRTMKVAAIARKHNVSTKTIQQQLKQGIQVEMEHTTDPKVAREIALDHLAEFPDYYSRLKRAETMDEQVAVNYGVGKTPGKLVKVGPKGKVPHARLHVNVPKKTAKKLGIPHTHMQQESASGYIPTKKQARDPRFSMALTQDIKPGEIGRQANKLKLDVDSQGHPDILIKGLRNALKEFQDTGKYHLLVEDEQLDEIRMDPTSLAAAASKINAKAGMEFEMIVPNIGVLDDREQEPDYGQDETIRTVDQIRNFFHDGNWNGRRLVDRFIDDVWQDYVESDWLSEQRQEDWGNDNISAVRDLVEGDYDDELYDQAVKEIEDKTPDFGVGTDEFKAAVQERYEKLVDERVEKILADRGDDYDRAFERWDDDWVQNKAGQNELFVEWLDSEGITIMSELSDRYSGIINWPYWTEGGNQDAEANLENIGSEFEAAIDRRVRVSTEYHSITRNATDYIIEPDSSLDGDNSGDAGLEFISPPLTINEMIDDLDTVKSWAKSIGAYTNVSTGLHMNVSLATDASLQNLDYVKLALLLGDEYVLNQFSRIANRYTLSALQKVKTRISQRPEEITRYFDLMKQGLGKQASEMIHSASTDKYVSINVKKGYIEFRSPGGDWLNEDFSKLKNTLLRFVVAMDAAMDPEKYRQEYLKKLYKILAPQGESDAVAIFARYSAGELPQTALKSFIRQIQLQRQITKEPQAGQGKKYWWEVKREGPWDSDGASLEIVASSESDALQKAAAAWGITSMTQMNRALARPLRPYEGGDQIRPGT